MATIQLVSAKRTAARPAKAIEWLVYRLGGAKAAYLGTVKAATREEAIAAAAVEYGVPVSRILVQQLG